MSDEQLPPDTLNEQEILPESAPEPAESSERYPELAELQNEIDRRIRDNQKFLDHFLDESFPDDDDEEDDDDTDEQLPEL
jgi:hypothetical protein